MKLPFQLFELPFFIQFLYNVGLQFSENQTKFLEKGSCGLADQYRLWRQYIVCIGVQRFQKKRQTFFVRVNSGFCINIFQCKKNPPSHLLISKRVFWRYTAAVLIYFSGFMDIFISLHPMLYDDSSWLTKCRNSKMTQEEILFTIFRSNFDRDSIIELCTP